ncbi:hypothetical protein LCGC14_2901910 [marine sediment metagenome]|uniref:Uncharacterized protein n=1 Tax=marine sediment metagenome TaxID=412755 RepID=A0A0F8YG17_9ZZZZ
MTIKQLKEILSEYADPTLVVSDSEINFVWALESGSKIVLGTVEKDELK